MNEIIEKLKKEFYVSANVEKNLNDGIKLIVSSDWKAKTSGVNRVNMYLSGVEPLSGEPLNKQKYSYTFDAVHTKYDSGIISLNGEYTIHFNAELMDGTIVENFLVPQKISLSSPKGKPYIFYSTVSAPIGWTGLKLESNCWRRCNGKLWVKFDGRYQLLPDFQEDAMRCYIPIAHRNFELLCSDLELPTPIKR